MIIRQDCRNWVHFKDRIDVVMYLCQVRFRTYLKMRCYNNNRERHKHVEKISHCWLRLKCCSWPQSQGLPIPLQIMICSVKLMMDASSLHNNNSKYRKLMKWSDVSETTLWARVPTITKIIMRLFLSLLIFTLICLGVYVSVKAYYVLHMFENTYCKQHPAGNT